MFGFLVSEWAGDHRVQGSWLMSNPYPTVAVSLAYLYFVKVFGPKFMSDRQPYSLKSVLIAYNFGLVLLNLWIFIDGGRFGWFGHYSWTCATCDKTDSRENLGVSLRFLSCHFQTNASCTHLLLYSLLFYKMANICWWFFFSKFIELFDTVFFILRKKTNQISTLHVVHHALLPISCWLTVKYVPVGQSTFLGFSNSFVHVLMYTYYALSAIGPSMTPYTTWKKYLTKIQMVQFLVMFLHSTQLFFIQCDFPRWFVWFNISHAVLFMGLFFDFYLKAYSVRGNRPSKVEQLTHMQSIGDDEDTQSSENYIASTKYVDDLRQLYRVSKGA